MGWMRAFRALGPTLVLTGLVLALAPPATAKSTAPTVVELQVHGVVDPFVASYLKDGLERASAQHAPAVLITIDTPGGLISSTREITQAILDSPVPVIGYVSPSGARAASAGTFILMSSPVAAMAPGTNVGAAHPVGISGAVESQKAENDAVASIRSLAEVYGRNADWAESAVRDSVSITDQEALDQNVIDVIAPDTASLFEQLDGTTATLGDGSAVTLDLPPGTPVEEESMSGVYAFFHGLLSPDLAFLFFWLGLALVILEFFVPGGVVGVVGGIMLVLSFAAIGMLPVQLVGLALLIASVVFFVLELKHPGTFVPTAGGVISLIVGGWLLFSPAVPNSRVSPWVIVPVAILATAFFTIVIRAAVRLRKVPPTPGLERLVGTHGTVLQPIDPQGVVHAESENWTAVSDTPIAKGRRVEILGVEGLRLKVRPAEAPAEAARTQKGER